MVFWPLNLLPQDIPDARIISWGYDANIAHFLEPTSNLKVKDHARSLSNDLGELRKYLDIIERPIIFVAHSLGGIIGAKVSHVHNLCRFSLTVRPEPARL